MTYSFFCPVKYFCKFTILTEKAKLFRMMVFSFTESAPAICNLSFVIMN